VTLILAWTVLVVVGCAALVGLSLLFIEEPEATIAMLVPFVGAGLVFAVIWALITVLQ
jgi:hypothetical protein